MNLIVAVSSDYAIGKDNKLLFNIPSDLAYFKEKTINKVVVMGEKTYFSLPRRPLPKRITIVLSDNEKFKDDNVIIVRNLQQLFDEVKKYNTDDVFVCGGASIYNLLMDYCKIAYVTKVNASVPADTYIKNIEKNGFVVKEISPVIKENNLEYTFQTMINKKPKKY